MLSLWTQSVRKETSPLRAALRGGHKTEALVIGGGMVGVLTAYHLQKAGIDCVLVEAQKVGSGASANNTGKITAQHGLCYQDLINECGIEDAIRYYEINSRAISDYEALCEKYPSDLLKQTAYVYSVNNKQKLDKEAEAYTRIGIEPVFRKDPQVPVKTVGAIGMKNQACFNPLKLLSGISGELTIYEDTLITDIQGKRALTASGFIEAEHIIICTHYPLVNVLGGYVLKLYQDRSFIIALENAPATDAMYIDESQNGLSLRMAGDLLLLCGGSRRTGKKGGGYPVLRGVAQQAYPDATEVFNWAAQDTMPLDSRPYIGRFSDKKQQWYIATGFKKWGITGAMSAARVLTELVVSGKSDYETLFNPGRSMLRPQVVINGLHSIAGLLRPTAPRCTHLGCALNWNNIEQTWDCPCHGSRFGAQGDVIDNPAKKRLKGV